MSTPVPAQPGWWQRNWKWCVPVLGALLLALSVAVVLGGVALLLGAIKSSGAYQHALARAQSDPAVIAALGEPIRAGWFVQGNISTSGASGDADLAIPSTARARMARYTWWPKNAQANGATRRWQ